MKKKFLRLAVALLILIMMATNLPLALAEPSEIAYYTLEETNPYFEQSEPTLTLSYRAPKLKSNRLAQPDDYYTDPADAAQVIRDAMEARVEEFTLCYVVEDQFPWDADEQTQRAWLHAIAIDLLVETAFEETENPTEGDSLRLGYRSQRIPMSIEELENGTKLTITYQTTYYTTASQEAELTAAVDALLKEFAFTAQTTEQEKARTIYRWICDNVDYDYTTESDIKHTAYAAMIRGKAVCQGYAVLFYRLAEEAGLDARIIAGVATQSGEAHGWNIVRIGAQYYYLDSTWDADKLITQYEYYLRGETDFDGHTNDPQYDTAEFRARYPIASERFITCGGDWWELCDWEQMQNDAEHWFQCSVCGDIKEKSLHFGGVATCTEQANCAVCLSAYGALRSHQWANDCDADCDFCGAIRTPAAHKGGTATCKERAKCSVCGVAYGNLAAHNFGGYVYNNDATTQKDGTQTRTCAVCQKSETITASGTKRQNPFKDVQSDQYYAAPVLWAVEKGITTGTSANSFSPESDCTRGQIVTFLWRAAGSPKPKSAKNPFRDVQKGAYYYDAVLWAVEKGITTGTSANTFSPDTACTRGQVVTFMWRAKNKPAANAANGFKDVQKGAYYYDAVLWAVKNGITNGTSEYSFSPESTCTRGQIVTFLYRGNK